MYTPSRAFASRTRCIAAACGSLAVCTVMLTAVCADARAAELYFDRPVPIYLQRPTASLFASWRSEDETRNSLEADSTRDLSATQLSLNFWTNGWIYHPAFLDFNLALSPEWTWRDSRSSTTDDRSDKSDFFGYSIETTWLKSKPYTISLKSSRDRRDDLSSIATTVTTESKADMAALQLSYPVLPTTISYSDTETITEDFFRTEFSQQRWQLESRQKTARSDSKLTISDMTQRRVIRGSSSESDRFLVFLSNNIAFAGGARLITNLNHVELISEDSSSSESKNTSINSNLTMPHRDNLNSNYGLSLNKNDIQDYGSRSASLQAGLRHRLYENLTTTVGASTGKTKFEDGDISSYGGTLNFAYVRRIPWGSVDMNFGVSERIQDDQVQSDFVQVRGESGTFEGIATTIILENINADPESVELTDSTGTIFYIEGIDYQVETVGRSTVITRDPFAGIGDNATVLVNYRFTSKLPAKTGFSSRSYGAQLTVWDKKLRFYFRGNELEERLIEGPAERELRYDKTERAGAQLNLRWSITRIEVEDRESNTTPIKRRVLSQNFNFRPKPNLSINFGAQLNRTELKDTGEKYTARGINAGIGWSIGRRGGHLRAGAFRRDNRNAEEKGLRVNYRWRFGQWFPLLRYEYTDEYNGFADETRKRELIYFEVKRRFR